MPVTITMPALSPTMEEGTLAKWLVKEGDEVRSGDVIAEIETDKAVMEVEAADEGKLGAILVAEGTEGVQVNAPIAVLLEDGESMDDVAAPPPAAAPAEPAVEPEAAAPEPASARMPEPEASLPAPTAPSANGERLFASPLARRIAADKGIDLASVKGSGPRGRIVKADVEAAEAAPAPAPAQAAAPKPAATTPAAGPDAARVAKLYQDREFDEVPLDGMRRTIAARLTEAKQTIPHFYLRRSIELDALLAFRSELNAQLEPKGVKVSVNDFVIKACALALIDEPDCNAAWAGDRMLRFKAADVAVAVAIDGGLITPVIRDAEAKTISAISTEMKDLAARARDRKLAPQEYQGGAFAVSNLGMFGIENFDAVINPPHGAILAVGAGVKTPVARGDQVEVATVMSVTLSVDHRVIDGALGAKLLAAIKGYLEAPLTMLA